MKPLPTHEFPYLYTDSENQTQEWLVTFLFTPGDPGKLSGLPENCYPSSAPEVEITSILSLPTGCSIDHTTLPDDLLEELEAEAFQYLEDLAEAEAEPEDYSPENYS